MATNYVQKLYASQTTLVSFKNPNRNYSSQSSFLMSNPNDEFLISFSKISPQYEKKQVLSCTVFIYGASTEDDYLGTGPRYLKENFEESTVTYNTRPSEDKPPCARAKFFLQPGWESFEIIPPDRLGISEVDSILAALKYGLVYEVSQYTPSNPDTEKGYIYGRRSSYIPYVEVILQDYIPHITSAYPSKGYVNPRNDLTFSWNFSKNGSMVPIAQASAKFRWRKSGETNYTEISISGSEQEITIPANTFPLEQIQWQVIVTTNDNVEGPSNKWYTLSTIDGESSAQAVSPNGVMVDGSEPVEFQWKHIIDTGSPQSKFDLEYSDDNGLTWELLKSEETTDTFTVIPADTLPAGNLLWRVRTYNSDGQPGEYSASASFVVRAAPSVPTISSVSAEARPVVRWQAVGQQAYEVDVLDAAGKQIYTTGETAGTDKEQKITEYLDAGTYTVRVRVWNIYGIASPWADASVTVPELDKAPPELSGWASSGVARLTRIAGDYLFYYLLRDGKPIAKLSAGQTEYLDYTVLGQHQYVLRGVTAQDQFKDSTAVRLNVRVPYAMLAPADDPGNWVELVYRRGGEPTRAENLTITGQAVFAAGRTLPFFESNGQRTKDWSFNYSFRTLEEYQALVDLVQQGKTVLYRGKDGSRCWVALTGIQTSADYLSRDYTLSAIEVDRIETIEYD